MTKPESGTSETFTERIHNPKNIKRGIGAVAAGASLAAAILYGPDAWKVIDNAVTKATTTESAIIVGVPGQVETRKIEYFDDGSGNTYSMTWFLIEQCPEDVAEVRKYGHVEGQPHFDPKLGEMYSNCTEDWAFVDANTFNNFPDGGTITYSGTVGEHLRK